MPTPTLQTPAIPIIRVDQSGNPIDAISGAGLQPVDTVVRAVSANRGASVGTTAVTLMPANLSRRGFSIQNQSSSATVYLSGVAAATADYNCLAIPPLSYYESPPHHAGTGAISVISTAATTSVYAREW